MATKKKLTPKTILEPGNYPIVDEHRRHYAVIPDKRKKGWTGVEIIIEGKGGYFNPDNNPTKVFHKNEEACQRACDIHNSYHGFSKACVDALYKRSLELQEGAKQTEG